MPEGLLVTVVIPAYGRTGLLEKTILSALAQDLDPAQFEVIVVDSSHDDHNVQLVSQLQRSKES